MTPAGAIAAPASSARAPPRSCSRAFPRGSRLHERCGQAQDLQVEQLRASDLLRRMRHTFPDEGRPPAGDGRFHRRDFGRAGGGRARLPYLLCEPAGLVRTCRHLAAPRPLQAMSSCRLPPAIRSHVRGHGDLFMRAAWKGPSRRAKADPRVICVCSFACAASSLHFPSLMTRLRAGLRASSGARPWARRRPWSPQAGRP